MSLSKNVFVYSYCLFLFICLFLVVINSNCSYINDLISAIAIASASISFGELFYTKASIDKKERQQICFLYNYYSIKGENILQDLEDKYKDDAENLMNLVLEVLDEKELDMISKNKDYYEKNKKKIFEKVDKVLENKEDIRIVKDYIEQLSQESDKEDEADEEAINNGLSNAIRKEKKNFIIANIIIILGFTAFFLFLTIPNLLGKYTNIVNNFLTVFAFISVILNVIIKDNYKAKSLQELSKERKEVLSNIKNNC